METLHFNPRMNLFEEKKWPLAVTFFEPLNSVFKITLKNNSFSTTTPEQRTPKRREELINKLIELLELRSQAILNCMLKSLKKEALEEI